MCFESHDAYGQDNYLIGPVAQLGSLLSGLAASKALSFLPWTWPEQSKVTGTFPT